MRTLVASLLVLLLSAAAALAQEPDAIPLWPQGAPGPHVEATPERVRLTEDGEHVATGVRQPSITPYLPAAGQATGTAIVVLPGGGHRELWMDHEGYRVGHWLAEHGVAAFVLKYRLSEEPNGPYRLERDSLADAQRAVRLIRSRAAEWRLAPDAVGIMGFSAGGQLAALTAWREAPGRATSPDVVERENGKPSFAALIYPGMTEHGAFSPSATPLFLLTGDQDRAQITEGLGELHLAMRRAGGSAELHVLAGAPHGFGLRDRNPPNIAVWPMLLINWLGAQGFLAKRAQP